MPKVYAAMAAEIIHEGHINLLAKAANLGEVIVGLLTDQAISSYKSPPLIPFEQRRKVVESLCQVTQVIPQATLSYKSNLLAIKPDFVIHGDDWKSGVQLETRSEVVAILSEWGGKLIEVPYTQGISTTAIKSAIRGEIPESRVSSLQNLIRNQNNALRFIDLHSALSGLIAEKTFITIDGKRIEFDGMWASSLTDSTSRGKPDIEAVDVSARIAGLQDTLDVTTKPIIFDGDTGGRPEHFAFTVRSLERNGVSAVIIEDKFGLKRNSLLSHSQPFTQESIEDFSSKIKSGREAKTNADFMIVARIESLILGKGVADALLRAESYMAAGADGIMIHSRQKEGKDAIEFVKRFRKQYEYFPLIIVPTSFNHITSSEFWALGVNVVIYANHLLRASYPAMLSVATNILLEGKTQGIENSIMSMPEILSLIPGTDS